MSIYLKTQQKPTHEAAWCIERVHGGPVPCTRVTLVSHLSISSLEDGFPLQSLMAGGVVGRSVGEHLSGRRSVQTGITLTAGFGGSEALRKTRLTEGVLALS